MPLIKIFIFVTSTATPPMLGAALKVRGDAVAAVLTEVLALGEVFTRRIDSLFKVTLVVPAVLAEAASLGV
jgi:hypothetical protein